MASPTETPQPPTLEDMQRWTWVIGRAQQLMLEHGVDMAMKTNGTPTPSAFPTLMEPTAIAQTAVDIWSDSIKLWQRFLTPGEQVDAPEAQPKDRRFAAPEWRQHPMFDLIRQSYLLVSQQMLKSVDLA